MGELEGEIEGNLSKPLVCLPQKTSIYASEVYLREFLLAKRGSNSYGPGSSSAEAAIDKRSGRIHQSKFPRRAPIYGKL